MEPSNTLELAQRIKNKHVKDSKGLISLQVPHFRLSQGEACVVYGSSPVGDEVLFHFA
jgi:hypothetical protein